MGLFEISLLLFDLKKLTLLLFFSFLLYPVIEIIYMKCFYYPYLLTGFQNRRFSATRFLFRLYPV